MKIIRTCDPTTINDNFFEILIVDIPSEMSSWSNNTNELFLSSNKTICSIHETMINKQFDSIDCTQRGWDGSFVDNLGMKINIYIMFKMYD